MNSRTLSWIAALLAAIGLGTASAADSSGQQLAEAAGRSLIGKPGPALQLTTIDGQHIDLASLYGHKAVYLKFWATWCVPCRQQMPHLEKTFEQAGPDLAVIAVNTGFNDTPEDVRAYRTSLGLRMPIVIDDGRLAAALHLRVTPQHVVVGRDGRILYVGHLADARVDEALKAARAQPAAAVAAGAPAAVTRALQVGDSVTDLRLAGVDGTALPVRDPAGSRTTVLMFMSPWCESYLSKSRPQRAAACKTAREQSERLAAVGGMRWIAVASGLWATPADLAAYRHEHHLAIPTVLDDSGGVFRQFGVQDVPTFILVSPAGKIATRREGSVPPGQPLAQVAPQR